MKRKIKQLLKIFFKPGTRRFRLARRLAVKLSLLKPVPFDVRYLEWTERAEPYTWSPTRELKYNPKVSIVVPVFNPPAAYFMPMVYSVVNQTYDNWELLLVDASTDRVSKMHTAQCSDIDERIKVVSIDRNLGIAGNTNAGIKQATGEYVALLDHDDVLAAQALYEMVLAAQDRPGLVYSDEDKISADGNERFHPHFKPDWSPHLLREVNYINHFSMIRRDVLEAEGGYRTGVDGAQDFDLYLRVTDRTQDIVHVPKILYHWRAALSSTAQDFSAKANILEAGIKSLEDHLSRQSLKGLVRPVKEQPGFYEINYENRFKVAVVLLPCEPRHQYKNLTDVYINNLNELSDVDVELHIQKLVEPLHVDVGAKVKYYKAGSRQKIIKEVKGNSEAEVFIIVGAGVTPLSKNWLGRLAGVLADHKVGVVSPLIMDSDELTIADHGLVSYDNKLIDVFKGYADNQHTYFGNSDWVRNIDAPSGRLFAVRREELDTVADCYDSLEFHPDKLIQALESRHLRSVMYGFVRMKYAGDPYYKNHNTHMFNPNLAQTSALYSISKSINVEAVNE
jgi:O-antigen biosynthesis protein